MSLYLDASVIVPSLIAEPSSARIKQWFSEITIELAISDLAHGEVVSALHRAVREGRELFVDVVERIATFEQWRVVASNIANHAPADMRTAIEHVRRFDLALRMPDALHLAACARLGLTLATFDRRLFRAAEALGVAVIRPA